MRENEREAPFEDSSLSAEEIQECIEWVRETSRTIHTFDWIELTLPTEETVKIRRPTGGMLVTHGLCPGHLSELAYNIAYADEEKGPTASSYEMSEERAQMLMVQLLNQVLEGGSAAFNMLSQKGQYIVWLIAEGRLEYPLSEDLEDFVRGTLFRLMSGYRCPPTTFPWLSSLKDTATGVDLDMAGAVYSEYFRIKEQQTLIKVMGGMLGATLSGGT